MHCDECDGMGMRRSAAGMVPCACAERRKLAKAIERIGLPARYQDATLETFLAAGRDKSVIAAHVLAKSYVREWTPGAACQGLLLSGTIGTGKTHLAAAILHQLVVEKGARGVFADFRGLLKRVQATYSHTIDQTEAQVLAPILAADVLVLDELGAMRSTDWVADAVEHVLNARYNASLPTIITTNYPLAATGRMHVVDNGYTGYERRAPMQEETLHDRIGARMVSRLHEMCRLIPMSGDDYRLKIAASR